MQDISIKQKKSIQINKGNLSKTLEVIFTGDTSFGENYQSRLKSKGRSNILEKQGYDYCLQKMKSFLFDADFVVANLETPITNIKISPFSDSKSYVHWADIEKTPEALLNHNVNIVSLANNHIFDFGKEGFNQTLSVLEEKKIKYFGAGQSIAEAEQAFIFEVNMGTAKFKCAVIAAFEKSNIYRKKYQTYADKNSSGVNPLQVKNIRKIIKKIKNSDLNTLVIVSPHWGSNYQWKNRKQTDMAKSLIDSGADYIIGHGAHMLQEIEKIEDKWVAYSLGNFMFNSPGRYSKLKAPPYSLIAKLYVEYNNKNFFSTIRFYPIVSDNLMTSYQPRFVTEKEFNEILWLLESHNIASSTCMSSLIKNIDQHGYYIELPKIALNIT